MDYKAIIIRVVPINSKLPYLRIVEGDSEKIVQTSDLTSKYSELSEYFCTIAEEHINSDCKFIMDDQEINLVDLNFIMSNYSEKVLSSKYNILLTYLQRTSFNSAFLGIHITGYNKNAKLTYTIFNN